MSRFRGFCWSRLRRLPLLFILLAAGCAANYVNPEFKNRADAAAKAAGLIVCIESIGLERGGLTRKPLPADESVMFVAMRNMQQLFSQRQLQRMGAPRLYLPEDLIGLGYAQGEAERDTKLLKALLKSAINNPRQAAQGDQLQAVRRLASLTGADIVLLGEIHTRVHTSEKSRSMANLLAIFAAAGGQYGVTASHDTAASKWVIIDPTDGSVLRALSDTVRLPDRGAAGRRGSSIDAPSS